MSKYRVYCDYDTSFALTSEGQQQLYRIFYKAFDLSREVFSRSQHKEISKPERIGMWVTFLRQEASLEGGYAKTESIRTTVKSLFNTKTWLDVGKLSPGHTYSHNRKAFGYIEYWMEKAMKDSKTEEDKAKDSLVALERILVEAELTNKVMDTVNTAATTVVDGLVQIASEIE